MEQNVEMKRSDPIRVFISQPMNGKTNEEIKMDRDAAIRSIRLRYPRAICPQTYIGTDPSAIVVNDGVWYLAMSLEILSQCDAIYMVEGWENARGCRIEREVALSYGLTEIEPVYSGTETDTDEVEGNKCRKYLVSYAYGNGQQSGSGSIVITQSFYAPITPQLLLDDVTGIIRDKLGFDESMTIYINTWTRFEAE